MASGKCVIGKKAPEFKTDALIGTEFKTVQLSDYSGKLDTCASCSSGQYSEPSRLASGKYLVLFFYPSDFGFVCPTEIIQFNDRVGEFRALNCEVPLARINLPRTAIDVARHCRGYKSCVTFLSLLICPAELEHSRRLGDRHPARLDTGGRMLRRLKVLASEVHRA